MHPVSKLTLQIFKNACTGKPPGHAFPIEPEDYGIYLADPRCRERCQGVLRGFFTGFESAVRRPRTLDALAEQVAPLYHPFYHEGAAMGYGLGRLVRLGAIASFPARMARAEDPFLFLRLVGLGFRLGFTSSPRGASRAARRFGNLGPLVHDGYGFQAGFFRWRGSAAATAMRLEGFSGFEKLSALNGLGRSLWFRFMDAPERGFAAARQCFDDALPLLGGLGLAAAFTFPDELGRGYGALHLLDGEERAAFQKGMRIALYVRDQNCSTFLQELLSRQPEEFRARAEVDLERARRVGSATREQPDFIERFHEGCTGP